MLFLWVVTFDVFRIGIVCIIPAPFAFEEIAFSGVIFEGHLDLMLFL